MAEADDECYVPLVDQQVFGACVKRKKIAFVPATQAHVSAPQERSTRRSLADRYLSIVLPKDISSSEATPSRIAEIGERAGSESPLCSVCKQPMSASEDKVAINAHESSIAHQVCLTHSHPPSHLDRNHVGLRYLKGYGWEPDSRLGLGARQDGVRIPIKAKAKHDTAGLREVEDEEDMQVKSRSVKMKEQPVRLLDAGKVRKQEQAAKKRAERLRATFYGNDLSQYLGPDE